MRTALRRHPGVLVVIVLLLLVIVGTVAAVVVWAAPIQGTSDELAAGAVVFAGATFALALIASGLAAIAYAESVRRPNLQVFAHLVQDARTGVLVGEVPPPTFLRTIGRPIVSTDLSGATALALPTSDSELLPPLWVNVVLRNRGDATARNVTVAVEILGLQVPVVQRVPEGWFVINRDPSSQSISLQWEGGTDLAVHPGLARFVVPAPLYETAAVPGTTVSVKTIAYADGSRPASCDAKHPVLGHDPPPRASETESTG
jgi:hypothetical protein